MNVVTDFLLSTKWKDDSYNSILVIIDQLIKIIYYKSIKVIINAPSLVEIIINIIVHHLRVLKLIVINWDLLFISKF